jgi:phospholipid/cholesterol/gamma-HCH transport system substrate-binding protein
MAKLSAEAKVGLLVLLGSIILLYMTFAVGKYEFGEKKGYTIEAVFDSVAGLDAQAAVRMAGVKIGAVESVTLEDSRAKLILRINPSVKIRRGSQAVIKTLGLLGEKYVEIVPPDRIYDRTPGDQERAGVYEGGERIEITASPSDVDRLISQLSGIADDVKQVTASLRQVFGTERGEKSMEDILADLRQTTANIKEFSYALRSDGSELAMRLNELASSLQGVVDENRDNLKVTMENVREASKSAEMALASIEDAARKIDRGEGTLGKLVNDDSMYNNIDTAAKGISDYTSRVERMQTIVGFRSEYLFPDAKSYFTLELKPRMDKYYILEVASDPRARYTRSETVVNGGAPTVYENFEDRLRFSVMFAKRWGNLAARMGLIESKGGVGADYFLFGDRVKFSFDAFNFNSTEPGNEDAHLKATVNWHIGKVVFLNAGYDNFLNSQRSSPFVGAGLRFDDEDLKYLLGSVPIPR